MESRTSMSLSSAMLLTAAATNYSPLSGLNNTDALSYSSVGRTSNTGLPELKSRCSFYGSEEIRCLVFPASRGTHMSGLVAPSSIYTANNVASLKCKSGLIT